MFVTISTFAAAGAIMNRIRGGAYKKRLSRKVGNKVISFGKFLNDIVFALLTTFSLSGFVPNEDSWWMYLTLHAAMWLGRAPGWGGYVGGIIDKVGNRPEFAFIDSLIKRFEKNYILRNTIGLSARGLFWGLCLTGALAICGHITPWVILASVLMGPIYVTTAYVAEKGFKHRGLGWPWGEYVFGAVLWGSVAVGLL